MNDTARARALAAEWLADDPAHRMYHTINEDRPDVLMFYFWVLLPSKPAQVGGPVMVFSSSMPARAAWLHRYILEQIAIDAKHAANTYHQQRSALATLAGDAETEGKRAESLRKAALAAMEGAP